MGTIEIRLCCCTQIQWAADFPAALRDAPRLGAVSQFAHPLHTFTQMRPEVEVRFPQSVSLTDSRSFVVHTKWMNGLTQEIVHGCIQCRIGRVLIRTDICYDNSQGLWILNAFVLCFDFNSGKPHPTPSALGVDTPYRTIPSYHMLCLYINRRQTS